MNGLILTYKIKHGRDFSKELALAKKVAVYSLENGVKSTKEVKQFGLKAVITNQIIRKYTRNKTIKKVNSVSLGIPSQHLIVKGRDIWVPCLKLKIPILFKQPFEKVNHLEIDDTFVSVLVTVKVPYEYQPITVLGVDLNASSHVLVASNITTGKILKLGKSCGHIHLKYKQIRRKLQKEKKYSYLKKILRREHNIICDINDKISLKLVRTAKDTNAIIVLETLGGIKAANRTRKEQRYSINSWSFYRLGKMIAYKAKKYGVPVAYIAPQYTSQRCSRCGHIAAKSRKLKKFHCVNCGVVENADVNAGFNIASLQFASTRHISIQ